ncbi:unnamed protein product [Closterium sp. NIES-65]|nr:unnamed protein product [Closterium sp. NIES-65]
MHPSFHVSLLRPYTDPNATFSGRDRTPLPVAVDTDEPDYQIQRILRHRRRLQGGVTFIDFLVRWRGYDAADDSWVPSSSLSPDNACLQAYLQSAGAADTIATFTGLRAAPAKVAVAKSVVSFTPRAQRLSISCAASPDTLTKVRGIIAQQLAVEVEKITADAKFVDLGADSLDTVEIMMALEEQFDITLDEEGAEKISTVQEAADLIEEQVAKA